MLWHATRTSTDRLFFIAYAPPGFSSPQWYLVQVDLTQTDPQRAQSRGVYHLRWWIAHHTDAATAAPVDCRYWPEIRELRDDGTMGSRVPLRPYKGDATLAKNPHLGWYQLRLELPALNIHGPFNFTPRQHKASVQCHCIGDHDWVQLEQRGPERQMSTDNIRRPPQTEHRNMARALSASATQPPSTKMQHITSAGKGIAQALKQKAAIEEGAPKTPITPQPKVYRPPLTSEYLDPDYLPDSADTVDILFQEHGKSLWKEKNPLPHASPPPSSSSPPTRTPPN